MQRKRNLAASVGGWSARHRWSAIGLWLLFVLAAALIGNAVGTAELKDYEAADGETATAERIIHDAKFNDPESEMVLVQGLSADDPRFRAAVGEVVSALAATGHVENLREPYDTTNPAPISRDRRSALIQFDMKGDADTAQDRVKPLMDAVAGVQWNHPGLRVEQAGGASAGLQIDKAIDDDLKRAEMLSLPLTLGILLAAFGALLAALVPVGLAMTGIFAAGGLLALTSQLLHVSDVTANLMLLIGLAVGVDYSLFYIRREREERAKGRTKAQALDIAAATSGRAVLISGVTVIVAMAGLFLTGNGEFMGFAEGTILVVFTAMLGSVTVLPAILSLLGDRIDARVVHGAVRVVTHGRVTWPRLLGGRNGGGRVWSGILSAVLRRPLVFSLIAAGVLVALAIPAFRMNAATPGNEDLQGDYPVLATFERIDAAFPGGDDPALIAVKAGDVTAPPVTAAIERFKVAAIASGVANEPFDIRINPDKTVAAVSIGIKGNGNDAVSERAITTLRSDVVPATLGHVPGVQAAVTGDAAGSMDFNNQMRRAGPLVFGFVLLFAFVLLLVSFRSVVVAITAIVLNLLSVAAAYGVLVLVFQDGRFESLLDFQANGTIANWLPLFLFVILFGLSMDYHVFILSRIREAYDRGMPTDAAVAHGIKATAGVVTSAAVVMVAVFGVFGTMSLLSIKQMGLGLAVAVLLDATIVRALLLPAVMKLLGEVNWYLPRWLEWLPRLSHGGEPVSGSRPPERLPIPMG